MAAIVLQRTGQRDQIRRCRVLAIDEVSMLSEWFFEFLDVFLQIIRGDPRPFGGTQLVLCGDFFQMPPVDEARLEHLSHTHTLSLFHSVCDSGCAQVLRAGAA